MKIGLVLSGGGIRGVAHLGVLQALTEAGIWAYFLDNELLFESDYLKIQKYLAEAPFTPGIGENSSSAPKLGVWTGWQIVKQYMEKNPDISLQELMLEKDAQKILVGSKYKPRD